MMKRFGSFAVALLALALSLTVILGVFSVPQEAMAQKGKDAVINTRGACLKAAEFKVLIQDESRKVKSGETLTLIVDIPNEVDAAKAIKELGYPVIKETRDRDKDSITYLLKVVK